MSAPAQTNAQQLRAELLRYLHVGDFDAITEKFGSKLTAKMYDRVERLAPLWAQKYTNEINLMCDDTDFAHDEGDGIGKVEQHQQQPQQQQQRQQQRPQQQQLQQQVQQQSQNQQQQQQQKQQQPPKQTKIVDLSAAAPQTQTTRVQDPSIQAPNEQRTHIRPHTNTRPPHGPQNISTLQIAHSPQAPQAVRSKSSASGATLHERKGGGGMHGHIVGKPQVKSNNSDVIDLAQSPLQNKQPLAQEEQQEEPPKKKKPPPRALEYPTPSSFVREPLPWVEEAEVIDDLIVGWVGY